LAGSFAILQILFDLPFHPFSLSGVVLRSFSAITGGVIFAVIYVSFLQPNLGYKIIVSDDRITAVHPSFQRFVERGHVRAVIDVPGNFLRTPALRISKHGRIGMWFWGGVSVPLALPECDSIRALALQWRSSSAG
jgi:hypothetical protein